MTTKRDSNKDEPKATERSKPHRKPPRDLPVGKKADHVTGGGGKVGDGGRTTGMVGDGG